MNRPIAYFITFHTHGSWLHGRAEGSVDRDHNQHGTPVLPEDERYEDRDRSAMSGPEVSLNEQSRQIVKKTILEVCEHRGWRLHALHVRTNHVHGVVAVACKPEKVMNDWKAWCTRRLREASIFKSDESVWSRHGSTLYLWLEVSVLEKIDYTLNQQGDPLAIYSDGVHDHRR